MLLLYGTRRGQNIIFWLFDFTVHLILGGKYSKIISKIAGYPNYIILEMSSFSIYEPNGIPSVFCESSSWEHNGIHLDFPVLGFPFLAQRKPKRQTHMWVVFQPEAQHVEED